MRLLDEVRCDEVYSFESKEDQCRFVQNNSDCQSANGLIDYLELVYCNFNDRKVEAIIAYIILMGFLFIALGLTTDSFFCPSLQVISKSLRLSQNVAGVTFLAFGNGAPDIFSCLAAVSQNRPELVLSALFGAGVFVSCVVAGCIMLIGPFEIQQGQFLRDVIFYLAAAFWAFSIFYAGHIDLSDALGFLVLYVIYILTVLLGPWMINLIRTAYGSRYEPLDASSEVTDSLDVQTPDVTINSGGTPNELLDDDIDIMFPNSMRLVMVTNFDDMAPLLSTNRGIMSANEDGWSRWRSFARSLSPVDISEWRSAAWYSRVFIVIKAPAMFILTVTVPLVDHDKPKHNWCQLLNALQCITFPVFITFSTTNAFVMLGALPLWAVVLIVGGAAASIVLVTSKPNTPPIYHTVFGYLGFAVSIVWIYNMANEIVDILKTFGVVFDINDAVLGLTVLAWGNSIGDFVANFTMAKNGSQVMGLSACYGGPLLNLLVGMGLSFTIRCIRQHNAIRVKFDTSVYILSGFLFGSLCSTLLAMVILRFHAKRTYGFYLVLLYLAFTTVAILNAVQIIP